MRANTDGRRFCAAVPAGGDALLLPPRGGRKPNLLPPSSILATEIIKALDRERLSVRQAHARTGIAAADFSRIRNADLGRFTVDRLMSIINRLGSRIEVAVKLKRSTAVQHVPTI